MLELLHVIDGSVLPHSQMVCDRPEVAGAKDLTHSGHFGVSSRLPFFFFFFFFFFSFFVFFLAPPSAYGGSPAAG